MIEEQFVSFETAKLLKKAGFDVPCTSQYTDNGFGWDNLSRANYNSCESLFSRPTQALAARWLREVHNIHVFAFFDYVKRDWCYCIANLDAVTAEMGMDVSENNYPTYEQALEAGLQEAIKLIKK